MTSEPQSREEPQPALPETSGGQSWHEEGWCEEIGGWFTLFAQLVIATQNAEPPLTVLGPVSYIATWPKEDREYFVRGFAECLLASQAERHCAPVETWVEVMSHRFDPIPDHIVGRFIEGRLSAEAEDAVRDHIERLDGERDTQVSGRMQ